MSYADSNAEIFDADVRNAAGPIVGFDRGAAKSLFDCGGDGSIERNRVAVDLRNRAVPANVARAGSPPDAERVRADGLDPLTGARSSHHDLVADFQTGD